MAFFYQTPDMDESLAVPEHVQYVTDEAAQSVVMDTRSGRIFGLDNSAGVIWRALADTGSASAAAAAVTARYGLSAERAAGDVATFVDQLVSAGLLTRSTGPR